MPLPSLKFFKHSLLICLMVPFIACVRSQVPSAEPGLRSDYKAYVPAKIVVYPCAIWQLPAEAASSIKDTKLCETFDAFVLQSFSNQPYMNGFPPSTIKRIAETEKDPKILDWVALWRESFIPGNEQSLDLIHFYETSIRSQNNWLLWLARSSQLTQYTDAVLLPVVEKSSEVKGNDRGIHTASRTLVINLFLIDSDNGKVIWVGKRESSITEKSVDQEVSYASWDKLFAQLFMESLWQDYPGRIQNRP